MNPLGLSAKDLKTYRAALKQSHQMRLRIEVLNQNEKPIGSFTTPTKRVLSGQVDIDVTQPVTRQLTLTLLDPDNRLPFDPDAPSTAAVAAHRMLKVERGVYVSGLGEWVNVPVFWGPITGYQRTGPTVTINGSGKEILLQAPHALPKAHTFRKGHQITDAIKTILTSMGEARFSIAELPAKLPHRFSVTRHQEPWPVLQRLARSLNRHLFYDASGRAVLRGHPGNPHLTISDDANGALVSEPQVTYTLDFRNAVEVLGPKPAGKNKRIRGWAVAPPSHPLSPQSLARNGVPRYMIETIGIPGPQPPAGLDPKVHHQASTVKGYQKALEHYHHLFLARQADAQAIANRRLRELLKAAVQVTFDMLPFAELDELDIVSCFWNGQKFESTLRQATIPLTSDTPMTFGYTHRVRQHARSHHHRRRRHHHRKRVH